MKRSEIEIRSKIVRKNASPSIQEVFYFRLKEFDDNDKVIFEKDFDTVHEVELWKSGATKKYNHLRGLYEKL